MIGRGEAEGERRDGPDFICAGLQKAGTQWLYDQLQHHPQFWMPPVKELHFFDRRFPDRKLREAAKRFLDAPERYAAGKRRRTHAAIGERSAAFLTMVATFDRKDDAIDSYARLFAPKGDLFTGDITPGYSVLDAKAIRRIARRFPDAKACLMLREPASRLWSAWRMQCEDALVPSLAVRSERRFREFAERPLVAARSFPSAIAGAWSEAFGERFAFFFLDDVIARPAETRAEVLRFLGADPDRGNAVPVDYNRKAKTRAARPSEPVRAYLRERFSQERRLCAEMFGGAATDWPGQPY